MSSAERGVSDEPTPPTSFPIGYLGDAPIDDPDTDRLRRSPFADRIADTIASRNDPTSVVSGIYGRWGEGKTSVLNFIEQRLAESDSIVCIRFNPWLYQSETELLLSFFESLATAVGRALKTKKEEMCKWLQTLGAAVGTFSVGLGIVTVAPGSMTMRSGHSEAGDGMARAGCSSGRAPSRVPKSVLSPTGKRCQQLSAADRVLAWVATERAGSGE